MPSTSARTSMSQSEEQLQELVKELQAMTIDQYVEIEKLEARVKTLEQRLDQIRQLANYEAV